MLVKHETAPKSLPTCTVVGLFFVHLLNLFRFSAFFAVLRLFLTFFRAYEIVALRPNLNGFQLSLALSDSLGPAGV